jgi:hypothetical protein
LKRIARFRRGKSGPLLVALALTLLITHCAPSEGPTPVGVVLEFIAHLSITADDQFLLTMEVRNTGDSTLLPSDAFNGVMELRDAEGDLRVRVDAPRLGGPLEPSHLMFPIAWTGRLAPGVHRLIWGALGYGAKAMEFEVIEQDGKIYLGSQFIRGYSKTDRVTFPRLDDYGRATPLVMMAKSDLQARVGVAPEQIIVRSVEIINRCKINLQNLKNLNHAFGVFWTLGSHLPNAFPAL